MSYYRALLWLKDSNPGVVEAAWNELAERTKADQGYVYVARIFNSPLCKIGKSVDPVRRIYGDLSSLPADIVHTFKTNQMSKLESALHQVFAANRVTGEWFNLDDDMIDFLRLFPVFNFAVVDRAIDLLIDNDVLMRDRRGFLVDKLPRIVVQPLPLHVLAQYDPEINFVPSELRRVQTPIPFVDMGSLRNQEQAA